MVHVSTTVFITQGNYIGYMFRLLNSHIQAYSLQVKSQDVVHTLGFQCVYIYEIQGAAERTPLFEKRINSKPKKIWQTFFYFSKAHRIPFYINMF